MEYNILTIWELSDIIKNLLKQWYKKFLLKWDLWVWKTEFTKQLAKQLWIKNISSPTYTYINIYSNKLLHWDLFRIKDKEEFINLWILDEINNFEYVCIEWPKFTELYKTDEFINIEIKKNWEKRNIKIN